MRHPLLCFIFLREVEYANFYRDSLSYGELRFEEPPRYMLQ